MRLTLMRVNLFTFIFLFSSLCFGGEEVIKKKKHKVMKAKHELFMLNIGTSEGSFMEDAVKVKALKLYNKPNKDSKVLHSIPINLKQHQADFYRPFDGKFGHAYFLGIFSKESVNNFYKIFYKGKYYWVKGDQFFEIERIDEILLQKCTGFPESIQFFDSPGGKNLNLKFLPGYKAHYGSFGLKATEYKWVDGKIWLKLRVDVDQDTLGKMVKEPVDAWIHPYDEALKPIYGYPYKGGCYALGDL